MSSAPLVWRLLGQATVGLCDEGESLQGGGGGGAMPAPPPPPHGGGDTVVALQLQQFQCNRKKKFPRISNAFFVKVMPPPHTHTGGGGCKGGGGTRSLWVSRYKMRGTLQVFATLQTGA